MSILPMGVNLISPIESLTSNARRSPKGASRRDERAAAFGKRARRFGRLELGLAGSWGQGAFAQLRTLPGRL